MPSDAPGGESPPQPDDLARLPHGRHGLPPEFVEHNQRQRLLASLIRTVADTGYNGATITGLAEGAGVTTRTFYKYFESVDSCYVAAFDLAAEILGGRLTDAYQGEAAWPVRIRSAIGAALEFFAAEPALARLLLTEPFVAGPDIMRPYRQQVEAIAECLSEGRDRYPEAASLPPTTERGLVGSLASQIGRKAAVGDAESLPAMLPELTQFVLTPFLSLSEARRIALADPE